MDTKEFFLMAGAVALGVVLAGYINRKVSHWESDLETAEDE